MSLTKLPEISPTDLRKPGRASFWLAAKPGLYALLIIAVILGSGIYSLRNGGIFSCSASGYGSDSYLGLCDAVSYGDYDHGAFWFGLEPAASAAAANAQVLFIGGSHTVFGFSSKDTAEWFSSLSATYYLLGFSFGENFTFEAPLLLRLRPTAKVYVINLHDFFNQEQTMAGKTVMRDESAKSQYEGKRQWQSIHKKICISFEAACGNAPAIFRSRSTGSWVATGRFKSAPVTYQDDIDEKTLASFTPLGKEFLRNLPVGQECTISTIVPMAKTEIGTAKALADALGINFVAPRLPGLMTFDGQHLAPASAERFSAAFLDQAGPQIRKCLGKEQDPPVNISTALPAQIAN